jgi:DNA-binding transcriptional LysR family regulator
MDSIENMKAFLMVSQTQSFVDAARRLRVAPSIVTKRVSQLEWQLHAPLLKRTTRSVHLTEAGERQLATIQRIVRDFEELRASDAEQPGAVEGNLRISAPAALTTVFLAPTLAAFRQAHPGVTLELVVLDRSVNPIEEGFDVSLAVLSATYDRVSEEIFRSYPRIACAAPAYLAKHGAPAHPRDLAHHLCIAFAPAGSVWTFAGAKGPTSVAIRPAVTSNDSRVVIAMIREGAGIGVASEPTVQDDLRDGRLVPVLPGYRLPDLSLKAFVPETRLHLARVQAFLAHLRETFGTGAP